MFRVPPIPFSMTRRQNWTLGLIARLAAFIGAIPGLWLLLRTIALPRELAPALLTGAGALILGGLAGSVGVRAARYWPAALTASLVRQIGAGIALGLLIGLSLLAIVWISGYSIWHIGSVWGLASASMACISSVIASCNYLRSLQTQQ